MKICAISAPRARSSEVRLRLSSWEAKLLVWNEFIEWIICQGAVSRTDCCLLEAAPPPWKRSPTNRSHFNCHFQWISAFLQQLWWSRLLVCEPRLGWKASSHGAAGSSLVDLEKNNQRIVAFFLHPQHSARWPRWHARCFKRLSKRCDGGCDGTQMALTSRRACFDWLSKPTVGPHLFI